MNKITVNDFKSMLASGCANLENYSNEIDTLNVFPVPDGDTGTNMSMTFTNGYNEAIKCDSDSVSDVAKAFSKGLLMGARGNSGVITSQIFRGFYQSVEGKTELDVKDISLAFENGARVAYKAIMKPVEGTILTVIRESSWYANNDVEKENIDLDTYFARLHQYCYESLQRTPDYLPVLKEVGVVDSGGTGILRIIEGFKKFIEGNPVEFKEKKETVQVNPALLLENEEFGYCTEFILRLKDELVDTFDEKVLKVKLTEMGGESLVVVKDEELVKVHVHTLTPGNALNIGQRYGEFIKLKIENMQEQHSSITANASAPVKEKTEEVKEPKKYGIVAVAAGEGITNLFKELGTDVIVSGGQTMNPSTQDFVNVVNDLKHCENILILPNNSNIILAAQQTADVLSDRKIFVLPTKSIQAGVSALSIFDDSIDPEDLIPALEEVISNVSIANVTYAIKDTSYEGVEVKNGDFMSMANKSILCSNPDLKEVIKTTLDYFINEDKEILTVITGEGSSEEINEFIDEYVNSNSKLEVQIIEGNQPVYSYLFGLE